MVKRGVVLGLLAALSIGSLAFTQNTGANDPKRIKELVDQLGSSRYVERERAQKELEVIGAPALEALRKAAKEGDLEVSQRAAEMVRKMEERITTTDILAPKKVKLSLKDTPVTEAIAELAKQSGYTLQIDGDKAALANRKVTLETGEVSYWEALDKLTAAAGLVEKSIQGNINPNPIRPPVRPLPPIKVRPVPIQPVPLPVQPLPRIQPAIPKVQPAPAVPNIQIDNVLPALPNVQPAQPAPARPNAQPAPAQPVKEVQAIQEAVENLAKAIQDVQIPVGPAQAVPAFPALPIQGIQIQAQAIQLQAMPVLPLQIGNGLVVARPFPGVAGPRQIVLADGKPDNRPTCYSGAVRIRVVPPSSKQGGVVNYVLEVDAEPRLTGFQIVGNPSITKAVDDKGQMLTVAQDAPANPNPNVNPALPIQIQNRLIAPLPFNPNGSRPIPVRVKLGEKDATMLKEFSGTLTAQVTLPPEPVMVIEKVMQAVGQTAKGKSGGSLSLQGIEKLPTGEYKVQMTLENPPQGAGNPFGGGNIQVIGNAQVQIQINGGGGFAVGGNSGGMPELVDEKGKAYQLVQIPNRNTQINNGVIRQVLTVHYRANAGQGDPARLVVTGTRTTNISVPFLFKDLPIPQ